MISHDNLTFTSSVATNLLGMNPKEENHIVSYLPLSHSEFVPIASEAHLLLQLRPKWLTFTLLSPSPVPCGLPSQMPSRVVSLPLSRRCTTCTMLSLTTTGSPNPVPRRPPCVGEDYGEDAACWCPDHWFQGSCGAASLKFSNGAV